MIGAIAKAIFGSSNDRYVKSLDKIVRQINAFEPTIEALTDEELAAQTVKFRRQLAEGKTLDEILPEAFATVREAGKRRMGMRHFDVQMIGGIVMHRGEIAEMRTGEGKTLVATLAVYLNALEGKGVHVVTVNDYLAKRDAEWMGQIYRFLGLTVGTILPNMAEDERRAAYGCDITYATNNELGFDYLRDNMKQERGQMVHRPFNFAIVDEVDSILIDEARTPLIISGPTDDKSDLYIAVDAIVKQIQEEHYEKDEKTKNITLTEEGVEWAERQLEAAGLLVGSNLYDVENTQVVHHLDQSLKANVMFKRDIDYIVKDDKVVIIDEFTGRMMDGRRWSNGLHQAVEAKEGVRIEPENQTMASITFQNYFRMYPKLAGMTGTAATEAAEFYDIYRMNVVTIPTNVPVQRIDEEDEFYKNTADKFQAIAKLIREKNETGQPVLVGTVSIEKSEMLSEYLKQEGVKHAVLNARFHEMEAHIVAQAGRLGAVTIATNMAGRGTDIKLGGNAEFRIEDELRDTPEGPERRLVEEAGFRFLALASPKFRRYFDLKTLALPIEFGAALWNAGRIVAREKPALVVGAGGYVQVALGYAAKLAGKKLLLHQQDVVPSLSNRLLAPFADPAIEDVAEGTARAGGGAQLGHHLAVDVIEAVKLEVVVGDHDEARGEARRLRVQDREPGHEGLAAAVAAAQELDPALARRFAPAPRTASPWSRPWSASPCWPPSACWPRPWLPGRTRWSCATRCRACAPDCSRGWPRRSTW